MGLLCVAEEVAIASGAPDASSDAVVETAAYAHLLFEDVAQNVVDEVSDEEVQLLVHESHFPKACAEEVPVDEASKSNNSSIDNPAAEEAVQSDEILSDIAEEAIEFDKCWKEDTVKASTSKEILDDSAEEAVVATDSVSDESVQQKLLALNLVATSPASLREFTTFVAGEKSRLKTFSIAQFASLAKECIGYNMIKEHREKSSTSTLPIEPSVGSAACSPEFAFAACASCG